MSLTLFHSAVADWFSNHFNYATSVQNQAWPAIKAKQTTLIAAPTGSGKTLAAFMSAIDDLIRAGIEGSLKNQTYVLYISPLKALSNDIQKNLQIPINGIRDSLLENGLDDVNVKAWVRTGDTPAGERSKMRRSPPHIVVTTPESLYILLTSESGRQMLSTVSTVIIDEIHALANSKRGAHLMLSLERLNALCAAQHYQFPNRIGLSATQKPIEEIANFLKGQHDSPCHIIDTGHKRDRDLGIEITQSPLEAVMANEVWDEIYQRLTQLVETHSTTLIFVNTRRLAERAAHNLAERIGEQFVTAHHGSLSKEHRLDAELRLKSGKLKALVATASLELGIDIGDIDLVCQLGSPRSIATFLQRVGRSGHSIDGTPKGRLFPLSRDDLIECCALLEAIQKEELDKIVFPQQCLDVLAQQIVAEVANQEWDVQQLYETFRQSWSYRNLSQQRFNDIVDMLAHGFSTRWGRRGAYIHHDAVNQKLRARRGARLTALTNGGAIPDQFDYDVLLLPEDCLIGNLNEDFAFESLPGDIFQLGNTSYRILKIEQGKVFVEDAHGQPPNIPFWFGEAPGRTDELSHTVSRLRTTLSEQLDKGIQTCTSYLTQQLFIPLTAAEQISEYLGAAQAALGVIPTHEHIVFERFFDEVGDMHLVIHAPFGSRINRAWGLALRKRFCRKFNFELQAAATEDNIILSLGPTHSFVLQDVAHYLSADSVKQILIQALLDAPVFATRWRWNTNISLAVPRFRNGKKVPAQFQRSNAEDLVAVIFPDQLACLENISGNREIPDHPLVEQTIDDCVNDNMDIEGLEEVLRKLHNGAIQLKCCDLSAPSPLAQEILNARPYAFLDDAPAEERRTLSVQQHRSTPQDAADLAKLDPAVVTELCQEIWPHPRNADELHDALFSLGFLTTKEIEQQHRYKGTLNRPTSSWRPWLSQLADEQRATLVSTTNNKSLWVSAERLQQLLIVYPQALLQPKIKPVIVKQNENLEWQHALTEIIRSRLEGLGPITQNELAQDFGIGESDIQTSLLQLEIEGFVVQGQFIIPDNNVSIKNSANVSSDRRPLNQATPSNLNSHFQVQWCERRLLSRLHKRNIKQLRSQVKPVSPAQFMSFLFGWQGINEKADGKEALARILKQYEGIALPAAAWETEVLPARLNIYIPDWLDNLCANGQFNWLRPRISGKTIKSSPLRTTPITIIGRPNLNFWLPIDTTNNSDNNSPLSPTAEKLLSHLKISGALFFVDLVQSSGLLRTQVENALGELVAQGLVTADSYAGLRALITPSNKRPRYSSTRNRRHRAVPTMDDAGRWSLLNTTNVSSNENQHNSPIEHIARVLLNRYGVIFRKLLERESLLPPWRDLLYVYRRLEARGEIRGGRFVSGFAGEQFALAEAISTLKSVRKDSDTGQYVCLSAADPLNFTGIITPEQRVSATLSNRILYRDGKPIAASQSNEVHFLEQLSSQSQYQARNLLLTKNNVLPFANSPLPAV